MAAFWRRRPRYKWMYELQRRAKRRKAVLIAVPVLLALVCAAVWLVPRAVPLIARFRTWRAASWQRSQIPEGGLSALFLDVGEADAAVLTCGGEVLVIDGGKDVLKVNHHGSNSSSCSAFLKKVRPRWAVISTGRGNDHDHPSQRVLDRLRSVGAAVLRTDECGTICISTDGKRITVSQFGEKS